MFGRQTGLENGDGAPQEGLGLGVPAGVTTEIAEVIEPDGDGGVVGAEGRLADCKGASEEGARPRRSGQSRDRLQRGY